MPIRIILRTDMSTSHFRRALLAILNPTVGDSSVLCSAYFSESSFYSVLDDQLLAAINTGCPSGIQVIAGKIGGDYQRGHFDRFISRLQSESSVPVSSHTVPQDNWHAKVFIRLKNGMPIAGIVGSSNLTGPAYGESRPPTPYNPAGWNYEADVIIWTGSSNLTPLIRDTGVQTPFGVIDTVLDPDVRQPTEGDQLHKINDTIMRMIE